MKKTFMKKYKESKHLIIGAGLLGANTANYIKENKNNSKVFLVSRNFPHKDVLYDYFFKIDFSKDVDDFINNIEKVDYIYNYAANVGDFNFLKNYNGETDKKINKNINKINGKLFFPSTSRVYNNNKIEFPIKNNYGKEKYKEEQKIINRKETIIGRIFNVFGKFSNNYNIIPSLWKKIKEAKDEIFIYGNGKQKRTFLHIKDCCDAVDFLFKKEFYNKPIDIGNSEIFTIDEVVDILINMSGKKIKKIYEKNDDKKDNLIFNNDELQKLGWSPKYSFIEGLKETFNF